MQVTIDSSESLDEVLSVLSTMFATRIVTDPAGTGTTAVPAQSAAPVKTGKTGKVSTASKRSTSSASPSVDTAAVRAWARDRVTAVSGRGALSKALIAQYQAAHA